MRALTTLFIAGVIIVSSVALIDAQQQPRRMRPPGMPQPQPQPYDQSQEQSEPTRVKAEFFQVTCTAASLASIDLDKLSAGQPSIEEITKRLKETGDAQLIIRIDNVIDLSGDSNLTAGTRLPTIQDVNVNKEGKMTPSITYQDVAMNANFRGYWDQTVDSYVAQINYSIDLSSVSRTGVKLSEGVQLPEFRHIRIGQRILIETGKPIMLLCNTQASPNDEEGRCTATILRLTATRLNPPVFKEPAE